MKNHKYYQIFRLLVLLSVILLLAGCGGGGGGGGGGVTPKTITFIMPKTYYASDGKEYPIPAGKEVKFYTLSDVETGIFSADHFFDGKTGSIKIQCPLPDSLIGKERYIFAVIELEGTFDPQGKSQQEIGEAAAKGEILFGRSLNIPYDQNPKLYTLTPGVEIGNFEFFGKAAGDPIEPTHMINFIMPDTYRDPGGNNYPIPEGKEVNFYASLEAGGEIIDFDYVFTGTTGGNVECDLPSSLIGEERYFYAVVVLEGDFDLEGKTQQETMDAVTEGKILFGRALGDEGEQKLYTLTPGVIIGNFEFFGKAAGDPIEPTHMINFIMPDTYRDPGGNNYPIPEGKEVNFYASLEAGGEIINFDYVFTGTTGGNIECDLPSSLIGEERYFYAVVVLEGDFDLEGKTQQETMDAVTEGKILFGRALGDEGEQKLYTLTPGVEIGNFEFFGKAAGDPIEPTHTINFIMPDTYLSLPSGEYYPIPAGKEVKFYSIELFPEEEGATYSADYVFTGETGSSRIQCKLPDFLIGEERYISAIVVLEGTYDVRGKTQNEVMEVCCLDRKILCGNSVEPEWGSIKYTLSDGIEIGNYDFWGVHPEEPRHKIYFTMPDTYRDPDGNVYPFPTGKEVKIYAVEKIGEHFGAHHVFTGITGGNIESELPFYLLKDFLGRDYYFYAVVVLEGDFDLEGKTQQEIDDAVNEGKILFGRSLEHLPDGNPKPYPLTPGIEIGNFEFFGKAAGDPTEPTHMINFIMPTTYLDQYERSCSIPAGKEVKFYVFLNELDPEDDPLYADHVFTGTTGGNIQCKLPPFLVGQQGYFLAVVVLEGDFDLQGKSGEELEEPFIEGKILFGMSLEGSDEQELKLHTLTDGASIGNFEFFGAGESSDGIIFMMAATYKDQGGFTYPIPEGKEVKFYAFSELGEQFTADYVFTATTGEYIECDLPPSLVGNDYYFFAVVVLEGDFDLEGKTEEEARAAVIDGKILFGKSINRPYDLNLKLHTLNPGVIIDNFDFFGPGVDGPSYNIKFNIPPTYQDEEGNNYPMPEGKEVKIYALAEVDENEPLEPVYVFKGPTLWPIECPLPESLIGERCYFYAIVELEETYELEGKTQQEIDQAVSEGKILFGRSWDPYLGILIPYLLEYGITIDLFEFTGVALGEPITKIKFNMPLYYQDEDNNEYDLPAGKEIRFYALPNLNEPFVAAGIFFGETGECDIEFDLPEELVGIECYFYAIIILEETKYDLHGSTEQQTWEEVAAGNILYGKSVDPWEGDPILYTLEYMRTFDCFKFIGAGE